MVFIQYGIQPNAGSSKYYNLPVKMVEPEVEMVETRVMVEAEKYKRKAPEEGEKTGRKKKQKEMGGSIEYELPGPSSRSTQAQKPTYSESQVSVSLGREQGLSGNV